MKVETVKYRNVLYVCWALALSAFVGSLYFSQIVGWAPCILCWYQRICIYPLVAILPVGILRRDPNVTYYTLPLVGIGWLISLYHSLLQLHILPEAVAPCALTTPCVTDYGVWFKVISLPTLSFCVFSLLLILLVYMVRLKRSQYE